MTRGNRRIYTAQTKNDAIGQVLRAGLPLAHVARSYEMPEQTLDNWISKARRGDPPKAATQVQSDNELMGENARLKAQCARLTMERDILKKGDGVLCKGCTVKYAWIDEHTG